MLNQRARITALERIAARNPPVRTLPTQTSMAGRALARLILGERLTHRSFDQATHTYRLSSPIEILRNDCRWHIADRWREEKTRDGERSARFKEYFLDTATRETLTPAELKWARDVLACEPQHPI